MIFAPHILQRKVPVPMQEDEFGRLMPGTGEEKWEDVCLCRCDDNSTKEFTSENGAVYRPSFHIVCERRAPVKAGDEIRCKIGEDLRGQGKVFMVKSTNFFGYSEIWV